MANIQINKISFTAYKRFAGTEELEIKPVTILVGKNSSGKSSITKLFPMLRCSLSDLSLKSALSLSNDGVSLSTSYRNLAHNGYSDGLAIRVTLSNGMDIKLEFTIGTKGELIVKLYSLVFEGKSYTLKLKNNQTTYSCAELGNEYSKSDFSGFIHKGLFRYLGIEQSFDLSIDYIGPLRINPQPLITTVMDTDFVGHDGAGAYSMLCLDPDLTKKVSAWFLTTLGCSLEVREPQLGSYQIMVHKLYMDKFDSNLAEEGMGIGQVLPIVTRCLKDVPDSLIVVEQPELHLHPAAHADIARLIARTSKESHQNYVVETHSHNFLLGIQDAIVDDTIPFDASDVVIYFVDEDETGSYLSTITIDKDGYLSDWPEGVFNESYELINEINRKSKK